MSAHPPTSASSADAAEELRSIREANPLLDLLTADGHTLRKCGGKWSVLCPFHREKTPSFSVCADGRFKCFGCGAGGDVFSYVMARDGVDFVTAKRTLAQRAGLDPGTTPKAVTRPRVLTSKPALADALRRVLTLPADLHRGCAAELRLVAERRGLSLEGIRLADKRGLLWFSGALRDRQPAWIVTDSERINAQARRLDGGRWEHIGSKKAWTLPGSRAAWPIGLRESVPFPCVVMVEGGPDLLAAHQLIASELRAGDVAAVAILGASNHLPAEAVELLAGKRIRLFPHADPPGQDAAVHWTRQLESAGATVDAFRFEGLLRADGQPVKDLNDFALLDCDSFEAERGQLESGVLP